MVLAVRGTPAPTRDPDSADYLALARHLWPTLSPPPSLVSLTVFHPPGYPVVVAVGHGLADVSGVLVLQVLLGVFTVLASFALGRQVAGSRAGLVAAGSSLRQTFPGLSTVRVRSWAAYSVLLTVLLFAAGLWGVVLLWKRSRPTALLIGVTAAYLLVITSGAEGEARFRVPAVPLLAVLAGVAAQRLFRSRDHEPLPDEGVASACQHGGRVL
jgi:asparagine N-glycosylation enzyme membrane subunit Stt3